MFLQCMVCSFNGAKCRHNIKLATYVLVGILISGDNTIVHGQLPIKKLTWYIIASTVTFLKLNLAIIYVVMYKTL